MKWVCLWSYEERTGPKQNKDLGVFIIQSTSTSGRSLILCDPVDTDLPSYRKAEVITRLPQLNIYFPGYERWQPGPDLGKIRIQWWCVAKSIGTGHHPWIPALALTGYMTLDKSFLFRALVFLMGHKMGAIITCSIFTKEE